jgi:hypothetical protein
LETGRAILRGAKFAAYGFAGLLACVLIYNVIAVGPEIPGQEASAELPSEQSTAVAVPGPPPLPGQASKRRDTAPSRTRLKTKAEPRASSGGGLEAPPQIREVEVADGGLSALPEAAPVAVAAVPKEAEEPKGIVIVVAPDGAGKESRGRRWIKTVGRALHLGKKDEQ